MIEPLVELTERKGAIEFRDADGPDGAAMWDSVVARSSEAWIWHDRLMRDYALAAAAPRAPIDRSFVVLVDGHPSALAPLAVETVRIGAHEGRETALYGAPVPWPCIVDDMADRERIEQAALDEIERRSRKAGAGVLRLQWWPAFVAGRKRAGLEAVFRNRSYTGHEFKSHLIAIDDGTLDRVRERFRRYNRKYGRSYSLEVLDGPAADEALEEAYYRLHVADAGGPSRPRDSYSRIAEMARAGKGFFVAAFPNDGGGVAGVLLVLHDAKAAYDSSVCVEPARRGDQVSVLLKWRAIEELQRRRIPYYELGRKTGYADWFSQPGEKSVGISFFKEGWSRGAERTVVVAERFLDRKMFDAAASERSQALATFSGLIEDAA